MIGPTSETAWEATWPAADYAQIGGFRVGRGMGGGDRVSAARAMTPWDAADIPAVERQHRDWNQSAIFAVMESDTALEAALRARGYAASGPTLILRAAVDCLTDRPVLPMTTFELWPPLVIQRDLWTATGIGKDRQAVMERVRVPKVAILGRIEDRAAGVAFAAADGRVAMLHALAVLPRWQRKGLAGWMLRRAAAFAARHGASDLVLAVSEPNVAARALYDQLGFEQFGRYHYWRKD